MPQRVFNAGVASIAKMHLQTDNNIDDLASHVYTYYKDSYKNDGVQEDWIISAKETIEYIEKNEIPEPIELLTHFQFFVDNFEPDGSPRKKKIFRGTFFNKADKNLNRKRDYLVLLKKYSVLAQNGLAPLAPKGWPENR